MSKDWRTILGFAAAGLVIAWVFVTYQVLTDSSPPSLSNMPWITMFMVLRPPSLLLIPLIDVETGTGDFYVIWTFIGLINAGLYAVIGAAFSGLRKKPDKSATS